MVTIALFAEASRPGADLRSLWRHGLLAILVPGAPALVLLWIRGDVVLGLFGADYVNEGLLRILLASAIPFSLSSIWFAWLRAQRRLTSLVGFAALAGGTVVVSASVLGLWLGVEGIALGWLAGQTVTAVVAVIGLARTLRASPSTAS
jgi:O-antigen/teichoic acid export membrane protein